MKKRRIIRRSKKNTQYTEEYLKTFIPKDDEVKEQDDVPNYFMKI